MTVRRRVHLSSLVLLLFGPSATAAFVPTTHPRASSLLQALPSMEDDISRQVERAKELVKKSKAKLAARQEQEQAGEGGELPFFAMSKQPVADKRGQVTKSTDGNGLITTDGEKMARLSEDEEWEARAFADVFKSENEQYRLVNEQHSDRDVAASMYNLRVTLQNEDYRKIFNERNRFIGEGN